MTGPARVALIPGCLALLPQNASLRDPIAELRAAVEEAAAWLGKDVEILATEQGRRVAEAALAARTSSDASAGRSVLVVLNGSACRTEKAPGYLDERAESFDASLRAALATPAADTLRRLDLALAEELWADVAVAPRLGDLLGDAGAGTVSGSARTVAVDFDASPYGVQYWVIRWEL